MYLYIPNIRTFRNPPYFFGCAIAEYLKPPSYRSLNTQF